MEMDTFEKAFQESKILKQVSLFSFSGGEPFLNRKLPQFVKVIHKYAKPKEIRFVTNGIYTNKVLSDLDEILKDNKGKYNIKLSLDGIGSTHDKIRGTEGCYRSASDTIEGIRELIKKYPGRLTASLGFTALSLNYKEIDDVFKLSEEKGFGFFYKPVMEADKLGTDNTDCDVYLNSEQEKYLIEFHKKLYDRLNKRHLTESLSYNYFYQYLERYYENPSRIVPCYACRASFHIAANWDVFSCLKLNYVIGNIRRNSLDEIWNSKKMYDFRDNVNKTSCHCLCVGEIIPSIITHKFPFLLSKKL